jgi:hypothetical protein
VLLGDVLPGDVLLGDVLPGDVLPGDVLRGDVLRGDVPCRKNQRKYLLSLQDRQPVQSGIRRSLAHPAHHPAHHFPAQLFLTTFESVYSDRNEYGIVVVEAALFGYSPDRKWVGFVLDASTV